MCDGSFLNLLCQSVYVTATSTRKPSLRTRSWRQRRSWARRRLRSNKPQQHLPKVTAALQNMSPSSTSSPFGLWGEGKKKKLPVCHNPQRSWVKDTHTELDFAHMETCNCHIAALTHGKVTFKNIMIAPCLMGFDVSLGFIRHANTCGAIITSTSFLTYTIIVCQGKKQHHKKFQ